jgi:hypothetical protein
MEFILIEGDWDGKLEEKSCFTTLHLSTSFGELLISENTVHWADSKYCAPGCLPTNYPKVLPNIRDRRLYSYNGIEDRKFYDQIGNLLAKL